MIDLSNPEYDMTFFMQRIAEESPTFRKQLESLLKDTDKEFPTNELWLGSLNIGPSKTYTQIKLTVTQEQAQFIDENNDGVI